MRLRWTRRELAVGAAGAAAGAVLAAAPEAEALTGSDLTILRTTASLELLSIFMYEHVIASGHLSASDHVVTKRILHHERSHAARLTRELSRAGQPPPAGPATVEQADAQLKSRHSSGSLAGIHSRTDCLHLLYDVESMAIGAYFDVIRNVGNRRLMRIAAEIMAVEGAHTSAIGQLEHPGELPKIVPVSFIQGSHPPEKN